MFENFTYKQKLFGLIIVAILLFITANKRSFQVTRRAYNQVDDLQKKLEYVNASTTSLSQMQSELNLYDKIIGKQGVGPEEVQQKILDFTTTFANIKVSGMEEIHTAESNGFNIITNQLVLEGDYNSLIEILYEFEKSFHFSNIVNISFLKEKEYKTRKNKLRVKIIFQNYEKNN